MTGAVYGYFARLAARRSSVVNLRNFVASQNPGLPFITNSLKPPFVQIQTCCVSARGFRTSPPSLAPENLQKAMADAARPLVICGPSGVGKSTLISRLMKAYPDTFGFSVSHTTRKPREGEKNGVNYHFVERKDFEEALTRGDFIENAEFSGNCYGTSKKAVSSVQNEGRICILDIEMVGAKQLKASPELDPYYVFISPPSMEALESRLRSRKTETEDAIRKRLDRADAEMAFGREPDNFDLIIVNDDVDKASEKLINFMKDKVKALTEIKEKAKL